MKLGIFSGIFHPEPGGPATYLHGILPELQARGWAVRVISYGDAPSDGYPYPVTRIPRRALPLRLTDYALKARPLLRWADVAYLHTLGLPLVGGRAPRVLKIVGDQAWERAVRRGWIAPTEDIDVFQTKRYGGVVDAQKVLRSREVRSMQRVIVPSNYLKRMVVGWGVDASRVQVIYNAHTGVTVTQTQREAREMLGLPDAPLLLTAARLMQWKGVQHIIAALKNLPDVRLVVAGDGAMLDALKVQATPLADRVTFTGRLSRDDVALYMRAADYTVLYSGYEGLSHTLLESLSLGTPVIASDKGGNPEVVRHKENGLLAPYVDVDALTDTLRDATQPGVRERLAANHALGMERFSRARLVEETDAVLRDTLQIRW